MKSACLCVRLRTRLEALNASATPPKRSSCGWQRETLDCRPALEQDAHRFSRPPSLSWQQSMWVSQPGPHAPPSQAAQAAPCQRSHRAPEVPDPRQIVRNTSGYSPYARPRRTVRRAPRWIRKTHARSSVRSSANALGRSGARALRCSGARGSLRSCTREPACSQAR